MGFVNMSSLLQELNNEMSSIVEKARLSLVRISNGRGGAGAGTIWHPDGLIVTNAHVVRRDSLEVILPDERKLPAKVLAHDPERDLAALSIEVNDLPTCNFFLLQIVYFKIKKLIGGK